MKDLTSDTALKVGLLLATVSWFSYIFYDFNILLFNRHINFPTIIEDIPIAWGLGFRMVAAATAIIVVVLYVIKREFSRREAETAFRLVLLFEGLYSLAFLGGALNFWKRNYFTLNRFLEQGLPCIVLGILIPALLIKLFFEMKPKNPKEGAVKWGLIYVTAFLLVFWLNNAGYWISSVLTKGTEYITQYPVNMLSFIVTTVGLFLLFLYSAGFTRKWLKVGIIEKVNLRKIGTVVTLLGLYPLFVFLLWLFFGAVGGWGTWYAWFLSHGHMTFIALPIPFISLPLLFRSNANRADTKFEPENRRIIIEKKTINFAITLMPSFWVHFLRSIFFSLLHSYSINPSSDRNRTFLLAITDIWYVILHFCIGAHYIFERCDSNSRGTRT